MYFLKQHFQVYFDFCDLHKIYSLKIIFKKVHLEEAICEWYLF